MSSVSPTVPLEDSATPTSTIKAPEPDLAKLESKLKAFTFTHANDDDSVQNGEKILESISSGSSSAGLATPFLEAYVHNGEAATRRRFSIGQQSVIPTLLNAQLNNIRLFDFDGHDNFKPSRPGYEDHVESKACLEHELSRISSALMTKKQMGRIVSGIRDIERTLNHVNIRAKIANIMIVTKIYDPEPNRWAKVVSEFLLGYNDEIKLYIQEDLKKDPDYKYNEIIGEKSGYKDRILFWSGDKCNHRPDLFDLIISMGGDGTVLFASWLFQTIIPPILPFSLGSLGFLTDFNVNEYKSILTKIIEDGYQCSIRMRFECTIMKSKNRNDPNAELAAQVKKLGTSAFTTHEIFESYTVFNEVVVDRGPNAVMTSLEMFGDRDPLTTAEADGLIISTPSGSTAYSLSAGGSLVHPEIPGILISPICPHTLSFRPLVIPESIILRLGVPYDARSTAWCAFDGKNRVELCRGDFITITASRYPLPCIKHSSSKNAWFERLSETLHWNERKKQKPLTTTEIFL